MKRLAIVLLLVIAAGSLATAQEFTTGSWDSYFKAGDTSVSLGAGVGLGSYFSLAAYPGFEQTVYDTKIADTVPIGIGVAAKGMVNLYIGGYSGIVVGAGVFVPFHFSLKGLDLAVLNMLDFYVAPGLAISFDTGDLGWTNPLDIGFGEYVGVNYFLSDSMAVFLEQVYWSTYYGGTVGVVLKL